MFKVLEVNTRRRLSRTASATSRPCQIEDGLTLPTTSLVACHRAHSDQPRVPYVNCASNPHNQKPSANGTEIKIKRLVLHVDDDDAILKIVGKTLQIGGSEVVSINDPRKASYAIAKWSPQVVILDLNMPGIDGMTLLREIKQRDASVQVVILTGMVTMATVRQATRFGAQELVFKPLNDLREIGTAVQRCFNGIEG